MEGYAGPSSASRFSVFVQGTPALFQGIVKGKCTRDDPFLATFDTGGLAAATGLAEIYIRPPIGLALQPTVPSGTRGMVGDCTFIGNHPTASLEMDGIKRVVAGMPLTYANAVTVASPIACEFDYQLSLSRTHNRMSPSRVELRDPRGNVGGIDTASHSQDSFHIRLDADARETTNWTVEWIPRVMPSGASFELAWFNFVHADVESSARHY